MIVPNIIYPFVTREIYAIERNIFPQMRCVFPQSGLIAQPEAPVSPISGEPSR